jgi:acyl-CoA synthetase (NDP forming)
MGKPIMVVKVGRSAQAQAAAIAHSGSLAGEDRATDAALAAAGVIRCADLDELLETAELVAGCQRMGRRVGRGRTGVVTVSTGEASLIADLAPRTGIDLPDVPPATRERLLRDLPTLGYIGNPLDPWGATEPAPAYAGAFGAFAESGAYDVLAIVHDFPYRSLPAEIETANEVTDQLLRATADRPDILPVYVSLTSGEPPKETKAQLDAAGGVPILRGALEAFSAIAAVARWEARRDARREVGGPRRDAWTKLAADRTTWGGEPPAAIRVTPTTAVLSERESLALLSAAGIPVTALREAIDSNAAVAAAREFGRPVALKLDAIGLPHKSDAGAIRLGLSGDAEVAAAADELLALGEILAAAGVSIRGLIVEPMASPGLELIVGLTRDPDFGPLVVVGLGGVLAEVLDDVVIRLAPVTSEEASAMLDDLRGARLLDGVLGRPAADRAAIAAIILAVAQLGVDRPDIAAIDLNPVISGPAETIAVDALVVMS